MSDPSLPKIDPNAYIRTYVPLLVGAALGWLVIHVPVVADAISWADANLVQWIDWRTALNAAAIAAVTAAYYWLARQIGRRWPAAERWLLGSSSQPLYVERDKSGRFE
jgi:hypothetical protein